MNLSKDRNNSCKGFTLIELLVVFGILALVGGVVSDLLIGIFKGTNKANVINEIKQNGDYVVNYIDRVVRNSSAVAYSSATEVVLEGQSEEEGGCVRFKIYDSVPGETNGYISLTKAVSCRFDEDGNFDPIATFSLEPELSLTNTASVSGVSVTEGEFVVSGGSGSPPTVSLNFTLSQGEKANSRNDYVASEVFQTLVSLRTY